MKHRIFVMTGTGLALLAGAAPGAAARAGTVSWSASPASYTVFKAGRYGLDSMEEVDDRGGLFLGVESGISPSRFVELGLSIDWFHRRRARNDVVVIDTTYDLPVEGRVDVDGASTDLVPLGAVLRLRFPVGDGRFAPFVAGHLTYDVLRLSSERLVLEGNDAILIEQTDYFSGPGGGVSLGLEARLDPRFGLLFEAGAHGSEPSKDIVVDGTPLSGHVVTDGEFARIGVRLGF